MKKMILPVLCLLGMAAQAQSSFFLQPFAGAGATNLLYKTYGNKTDNLQNASTYDAGVLAGYNEDRWVLNFGLQYLRTGGLQKSYFTDPLWHFIRSTNMHLYFNHLAIPLSAGYTLRPDRTISLTPTVGAAFSYNLSASETDYSGKIQHMPQTEFENTYNQFSAFAVVKVVADYYVSDRVSIVFGPEMYYMVTNMARNYGTFYTDRIHTYALLMNVGLKWKLAKKSASPDDETGEPE